MNYDDVTIYDRIQRFDLAPSQIKSTEVLEIAKCILELESGIADEMEIQPHVFSKSLDAKP